MLVTQVLNIGNADESIYAKINQTGEVERILQLANHSAFLDIISYAPLLHVRASRLR